MIIESIAIQRPQQTNTGRPTTFEQFMTNELRLIVAHNIGTMNASSEVLTLLMLAGLPGTGKTTLAYELARLFRWTLLDKDLLNAELLKAGVPQSQAAPLAYALIFSLARDLIVQQRQSVILDTAGRQPEILEQATCIAQEGHAQLRILRLVAPHSVRMERMSGRTARASQWLTDQTTDQEQAQWYAHLSEKAFVVSSDQPLDQLFSGVLAFIRNGRAPL